MFKNYLKVAFRYLLRHKGYSLINILGLAVGITVCMLIMVFVRSEFSYDKFHANAKNIYRIWQREKADGKEFINTETSLAAAPALQAAFPEVATTCRVYSFKTLVKNSDNSFYESVTMVDNSFFSMFSFNLSDADRLKPFPSVNAVILTPAMTKKYFGTAAAVGKNIEQQLGEEYGKEEYDLHLQPITNIHLNTSLPAANLPTSDPKYSYILATIGILILLVACINFITLSIGRSATRALEVGIRKTMGANRQQLMRQFWGEAFLMTIIAFIIGLLLSIILISPFSRLTEHTLALHFDQTFILFCILLITAITLIAGIYPAVILSGFNPVEVLKGKLRKSSISAGLLRKGLIVGQFTASIIMIISTIIISRQMQYLQNKNLGYNKEQVIVVPTNKKRADGYALSKLYKAELAKHPEVVSATTDVFSFAEIPWATLGFSDEKKSYHSFQYNEVDQSFIDAMQIKMQDGRWFDGANTADSNNSIVVNEALVKEYGITDPIGKRVAKYSQQIVGVMKDFNFESLHTAVKPLVVSLKADTIFRQSEDISFQSSPQPRISVRMKAGNMAMNVKILSDAWRAVAPNQEFEYQFLDESLAASYKQEQKSSSIVKLASALSVFIACMGLFGLATLTVTRRTEEIGIRKIMGANVLQIVQLVSKDFVVLVAVAALISFPVARWAMRNWLADFSYRVDISWWVFLVAGGLAIFIALVTVAFQAIKAALANPVKSLRTL